MIYEEFFVFSDELIFFFLIIVFGKVTYFSIEKSVVQSANGVIRYKK